MRLFAFERRWLLQVFHLILPRSRFFPIGAQDIPMHRFLDDLLNRAPLSFVFGLRFALLALILYPLFSARRPRLLFSLSIEDQENTIEMMARSPFYLVREMPVLLKMTACLGFFGMPEVQRAMGIEHGDLLPAPHLRKEMRP